MAVCVGLSVLLGYNILSHWERYVLFSRGLFYSGPLVDQARWQAWADRNKDFLGPLANGAKVAVVSDPRDSTGLLLEKSANGIHVSKTHMLFRKRCDVLLAIDAKEAESWLALSLPQQGNGFWDAVKRSTGQGRTRVYTTGSSEDLQRQGFIEFLRSFDARPNLPQMPPARGEKLRSPRSG